MELIILLSFCTTDAFASESKKENKVFQWEDYKVAAHALGGMNDLNYLNSKESFVNAYENGIRLFEVDLSRTSDGIWVCRHSWKESLGQWNENNQRILSYEEFMSSSIYGQYTPLSFTDLLLLLKEYPDAYVMIDSKQYSVRSYQRTVEDYAELLEEAQSAGAEKQMSQLIPEIYNQSMFSGIKLIYDFPAYIFSLWKEYSKQEIEEIADFCKEKGILAAAVYSDYWNDEIQNIFDQRKIHVFVYTVNDIKDAQSYLKQGAQGICSDFLLDPDLKTNKKEN
ncbi:MAG: phosphatidylinositol-specific phospholipase C/glycerophosphodiester phosphodiesterase family protein [Blautia sp.]|nr:phosphatidylinositol-specific phospholipase C/glycerophosphodiester phosphodiesterase family protein [Blautia sp.]